MRIYLDNCCFNRPYDDQLHIRIKLETEAKLRIQDDIRNGLYQLVWSYILDYENGKNPFDERAGLIFKSNNWPIRIYKGSAIMITDTEIKITGFQILAKNMGDVEAERLHCSYTAGTI